MCNPTSVLAQLLVSLDLGARRDFALDPVLEGGLLGNLARGFEACDDGGSVVALGVGEVAEVEGGLDVGVGAGEVDLTAGAGAGDVGCHAEGVDGGFVAKTRKLLVTNIGCSGDIQTYRAVLRQKGIW